MQIMFDAISVTNETSFVPSSGGGEGVDATSGLDNIEGQEEEHPPITPNVRPSSRKRPATTSPKGKKKTFRDQCMKRLVAAYEKKAESSNYSATSNVVNSVRKEIGNMLDQVIKDGAEEGSDEHYYATQLLIKKEYRDVFITLKTSNGRLNWLRRTWADSKK
jgi:DNA-directed RNA polymerase